MREKPTYEELEQRVGELEAAEVERKKTVAELRESRRKHRTLFETISDAVYVHDIDGRILDFNPVACERLGYDREEMRSLHVTDIDIDHPTKAAVRQKIASAITSGPLTIESRHRTKDGKVIDVELKINTFPSPDGELFVTVARDITDRKRAGTALRKKENMLSHAEKMANIGSWEWEIATDTVTWSEQLFHIFGFDPADNAPSWREQRAFFHPEDFAALEQTVDAAVKDRKPYELEVRIRRNDGETRVCSMHGYPETGPDGRAVRLFGSAQDITDHKQTEDKLRRSEERLRTVLESMGDEVYVHDATGRFILVNEAACRGTGYRRNELLRMNVDDVVPQRRFFKTQGRWPDFDRNSPFCFETRHKRRDGSVYPVEITLTRILMDDGQAFLALARDITKRKHAEEVLKESEAQYRRLLDTLEEGYLKVDLGGHVVMANAASAKLFGYPSPEEMLGVHMHKLYADPDDRGGNIEELKRKRFLTNYEVAARTKNGRRFWTSCNVRLIVDEHNEMAGVEALIRDITDHKQTEHALRRSEARYHAIYDQAAVGITVVSRDGHILEANSTMCAMLGYTPEELIRLTVFDINHPEDIERQRPLIQEVLDGNRDTFHLEKRYLQKNSQPIWVHHSSNVVRKETGSIEYVIGVSADITRRKQAEENLRKSEERLRVVLESIGDEVFLHDFEGRFLLVNEAACRNTGYRRDELLHMRVRDIDPRSVSRDDSKEYWAKLGAGASVQFLAEHTRRDGSVYPVEINLNRIQIPEGEAVIALARDITDRKRTESNLKKSLAEKEVLLREIHHRVKNNMQAISGLLRMHARRADDARLTEIFTDCRDRIGAMALIHEALYQSENLAKIDFKAYLKKLCRNLARAHDAQRRRIDLTASAADVSMDMDQGIAVGMIIAELISNAFKHAFPNDEGGAVSVHLDREDGENVRLIVSDTGKGLPSDFDIRNPPSLGMRLVVGAVTRELGGRIESKNDGGSVFVIWFECGSA